jgi:hypothetical protein
MTNIKVFTLAGILDFFLTLPEIAYEKTIELFAHFQEWISVIPIGKIALTICFYGGSITLLYVIFRLLSRYVYKPSKHWLIKTLESPIQKIIYCMSSIVQKIKKHKPRLRPPSTNNSAFSEEQTMVLRELNEKFNMKRYEKDRIIGREINNIKKTINKKGQVEVDALAAIYMLRNFFCGSMVDENGNVILRQLPNSFRTDNEFFRIDIPDADEGKENLITNEDGTIDYDVYGQTTDGDKLTFHYKIAPGGDILIKTMSVEKKDAESKKNKNADAENVKRNNTQTEQMAEAAMLLATNANKENEELRLEIAKISRERSKPKKKALKEAVEEIEYGGEQLETNSDADNEAMPAMEAPDEPSSAIADFATSIGKAKKKSKSDTPNKEDIADPVARAAVAVQTNESESDQNITQPILTFEADEQPTSIDYVGLLKELDVDRLDRAFEWLATVAQALDAPSPLIISDGNYYLELGLYHALTIRLFEPEYRRGFAKWLRGGTELIGRQQQWDALNAINNVFLAITKVIDPQIPTPLVKIEDK